MLLIKMFIHRAISAIKSSECRDELFILKSSLPVRHRPVPSSVDFKWTKSFTEANNYFCVLIGWIEKKNEKRK